MKTWEYFVETVAVTKTGNVISTGLYNAPVEMTAAQYMNLMGSHGWELVIAFRGNGTVEFIFKQEKNG